jgi:uncharacterized coiled-coil protein SlyX
VADAELNNRLREAEFRLAQLEYLYRILSEQLGQAQVQAGMIRAAGAS